MNNEDEFDGCFLASLTGIGVLSIASIAFFVWVVVKLMAHFGVL